MTASPTTPPDLAIAPRDLRFAEDAAAGRWWLGGDVVGTTFFNALSATFPHGERFFMDSVRRFRAAAPPELGRQIAGFLSQEAMHTREHLAFNRRAAGHGVSMSRMEARTEARMAFARTRRPLVQLAATVALEHITAILADALLTDPRHLAGAPDEAAALWRWHAIEEIEHKAVAFDTFLAATQSLSGASRWLLRASTMVGATWLLVDTVGRNIADSFSEDGVNRPATWAKLAGYLLFRPGMLRQAAGAYLGYFAPGFHPWRRDNRALAAEAEKRLQARASLGAPA